MSIYKVFGSIVVAIQREEAYTQHATASKIRGNWYSEDMPSQSRQSSLYSTPTPYFRANKKWLAS